MSKLLPFAIYILVALPLSSSKCHAVESSNLGNVIADVRRDIRTETDRLNEVRERIAEERIALARSVESLEDEVSRLRKRADALRELEGEHRSGFARLNEEISHLGDEIDFCSSISSEYRRDMGKRMSVAEERRLQGELTNIDRLLEAEETEDALRVAGPLLDFVARRTEENLGGSVFEGKCLDNSGVLHEGKFVQAGPITFFVSEKLDLAGIAGMKLGSTQPAIISEQDMDAIAKLAGGQEAAVPVDFTLGEAIKVAELKRGWIEHIRAGGIVMYPILALGVVCILIIIWKFVSLSRLKIAVEPSLSSILGLLNEGRLEQAEKEAISLGQPVGPVLVEGVHHHDASREDLEEIMHERILSQTPMLERYLPLLAVSAAAAPLLGLLGTVTGMIHTFNLVTVFGTGKAKLLSSGISEALITTEFGLIIAIPTMLIHAYLSRRVRRVIHTLEKTSISFINCLKIKPGNDSKAGG
jgi:biopolymer transport protein ExbB